MISVITCTGNRHQAFALCEKMMSPQKIGGQGLQWIVVDDYPKNPTGVTLGQDYHKAQMEWKPGINTQRMNMHQALSHVKGDILLIFEDDDYYSPNYLEAMIKLLDNALIAGISNSKYYHLGMPGYKYINNYRHSSLANVAIRKEIFPLLFEAVHSGEYYFDIDLYKKVQAKRIPSVLISDSNLSVGMKGLPGKAGLGMGHSKDGYFEDPNLEILKLWTGDFHKNYLPFINTKKEKEKEKEKEKVTTSKSTSRDKYFEAINH